MEPFEFTGMNSWCSSRTQREKLRNVFPGCSGGLSLHVRDLTESPFQVNDSEELNSDENLLRTPRK